MSLNHAVARNHVETHDPFFLMIKKGKDISLTVTLMTADSWVSPKNKKKSEQGVIEDNA